MDAIKGSGPAIGILCTDGIILATEKQTTSVLLEKNVNSEKVYRIDNHIICVASGLTADSNYLIEYSREAGQQFRMSYRNPMQVEQLVQRVSDLKQSYTQYGGIRPFGTSFIFAGFDSRNGFQLFTTDPAGNYLKWKAIAHGTRVISRHRRSERELFPAEGVRRLDQPREGTGARPGHPLQNPGLRKPSAGKARAGPLDSLQRRRRSAPARADARRSQGRAEEERRAREEKTA